MRALVPTSQDTFRPRGAPPPPVSQPLSEVIKTTAGELVTLVTAEAKLARLEIATSVRSAVSRAGLVVVAAIPLLLGYLLAVAALAAWLSTPWGWPGALAIAALSQVVIGATLLFSATRKPRVSRPAPLTAGGANA